MSKKIRMFALIALAALVIAGTVSADWYSEDRYASVGCNGFTIRNNVWGSGAGFQCIWANWGGGWQYWGVWSNQPNTGNVKSYPHIAKWIGRNTNNIPWCGFWFQCTRPGWGTYNTAADIWLNGHAYELMLWMNWRGQSPIGSYQTTASIGGASWNVYSGWNGSNTVYSFLRNGHTNGGSVDTKAIYNWLQWNNWFNNPYLEDVQMGFEICSINGGAVFEMNGFSEWHG
jgi:hypothetical protein